MEDITGKTFNRLTVKRMLPRYKKNSQGKNITYCECECSCGATNVIVMASKLKSGHTQSCGCLQKERSSEAISAATRTHGLSNTKAYQIWRAMKSRCDNPADKHYEYYGGKGISVCDSWHESFICFYIWLTNNGYVESYERNTEQTIDRIDYDGNYEPSNCRLVSMDKQANNKSNNKTFSYDGETHTYAEWAKIIGIKYKSFMNRVYRGWDFERIINTPI